MWDALIAQQGVLDHKTEHVSRHYRFGEELGSGFSGVVKICEDAATQEQLACKTIHKSKLRWKDYGDVRKEISILKRVSAHSHIVALRAVHEDDEAVHLIMELCRGGDLFDEVVNRGPLGEASAGRVMAQVVEALAYCHSLGIMHRDLKPENILLVEESGRSPHNPEPKESMRVKLADFGLAVSLDRGREVSGFAGSPCYVAPEVIAQKRHGKEADIWSLGVVLYVLLAGNFPFNGDTDEQLFRAIQEGELHMDQAPWPTVSEECKRLIRSMLRKDGRQRPTAIDILRHPWIVGTNLQSRDSSTPGAPTIQNLEPSPPHGALDGLSHSQSHRKLLLDFVSGGKSDASAHSDPHAIIDSPRTSGRVPAPDREIRTRPPALSSLTIAGSQVREAKSAPPSPNCHFDLLQSSMASSDSCSSPLRDHQRHPRPPQEQEQEQHGMQVVHSSGFSTDEACASKMDPPASTISLRQLCSSWHPLSSILPCLPQMMKFQNEVGVLEDTVIGIPVFW